MKTKSYKSTHMQYLQPLFIVLKCFGVTSPTLSNRKPTNLLWTTYSAILALTVFAVYFEMLFLKITYSPDLSRNLFFGVMDTLCEVFLVMSDVSTIIDTTILKRDLTMSFMNLMLKDASNKQRATIFLTEFICVMFCVVLYHAYHLYVFVFRVSVVVFYRYIFFREISLYLTAINLLQLYNFVLIIRDKYMVLNRSLQKRVKAAQRDVFTLTECNNNVDVYLRKYIEYCELVNVFNKLFGSRIFWVIGYVVIDTVEGFQIGLNCFAHVRLHRLGDESCAFVGGATLTELSIYSVRNFDFQSFTTHYNCFL